MADDKESIFDRAESLFRRTFERLGAKVDSKLSADSIATLNPREIGDIIAKLERAIDANLKPDDRGVKRVAPNYLKVLITYERAVNLNRMHTSALCKELRATAYEYITNRRYETKGPIQLIMARDVLEKASVVRASFDAKEFAVPANELLAPQTTEEPTPADVGHYLTIREEDGTLHRFEMKVGEAPVYLGRASGNRLRIDDQSISRIHCSFSLQSTGLYYLADLNSSNGTSVNGEPLPANIARELHIGDVIQVGDIRLTIEEVS